MRAYLQSKESKKNLMHCAYSFEEKLIKKEFEVFFEEKYLTISCIDHTELLRN